MKKKKTLIGTKPLFYKLDQIEGHDIINTPYEFEFAKHLFKIQDSFFIFYFYDVLNFSTMEKLKIYI